MALPDVQVDLRGLRALAIDGDYRCTVCGYRAVAARAPDTCPMCQCAAWEWAAWQPFSRNPLLSGAQKVKLSRQLHAVG